MTEKSQKPEFFWGAIEYSNNYHQIIINKKECNGKNEYDC